MALGRRLICLNTPSRPVHDQVIPFEGAPPPADYNCTATEPVHLLHIHGTDDHTVYYDGKHRDMSAVESGSAPFATSNSPTF